MPYTVRSRRARAHAPQSPHTPFPTTPRSLNADGLDAPRPRGVALAAALLMACGAGSATAQTAAAPSDGAAQRVEIVGTSPMPGLGVDRHLLPYASRTVQRGQIDQAQTVNATDFLATRVPGMQVSDIQGSPFQGELSYRGYRASGLMGSAQGLSVYLDGVRINEAFGDLVNWDLVPEFALSSMSVVSSANPSFGLNTLGGAIALQTVDGRSAPGVEASLRLGSHHRLQVQAGLGQSHAQGWHSWVGGTAFREDGWRDHSKGRQGLVMARIGRAQPDVDWSVSLLGGRSTLIGNGLTPAVTLDEDGVATPDLLATRRSAVFTHPDLTRNRLAQASVQMDRKLAQGLLLQGLAYVRQSDRDTVNGDLAEEEEDDDDTSAEANRVLRRALAEGDDPVAAAAMNRTHTTQRAWGAALSMAQRQGAHQWQAGVSLDASRVRFRQTEQEGTLDATRGVVVGDEADEASAAVRGHSHAIGLYATDTWQLAPGTHLTGTLRANQAKVTNTLSTPDDVTGELAAQPTESFTYRSLNPALGVTQQLASGLSAFANVARNTRVPTVIELGCADPEQPCRLPAGLQSDPYLKQVRATGIEAGLRWRPADGHRVELVAFRTDNRDDILFGSVSSTSQLGYFRNVDKTRHQGLELSWEARRGAWSGALAYSGLSATYQSNETLRMGERNVTVTPGTRMAGVPRHSLKASLDWQALPAWHFGADLQAVGRRGVQGNEDGLLEDDGEATHWLKVPGHALVHLRAQWQATEAISVGLRVANAFNRQTASYGALAETVFDAQGQFTGVEREALFLAPGTPRTVSLTLNVRY